jgi:hypothetical protein
MRSTPENGPRVTVEHEKVTETQILVERTEDHPEGPGVTVIKTFESKESKQ